MANMPQYQCHKKVRAAKIVAIDGLPEGGITIHLEGPKGEKLEPVHMNEIWAERHAAHLGGYLVQYEDGYHSYSPAAAFEGGYTLIEGQ